MNYLFDYRPYLIGLIAIGLTTVMMLRPAIHQPEDYHLFADSITVIGIPNFWNVISNCFFIIISIAGLYKLYTHQRTLNPVSLAFYAGVLGTGFGSAFYHLSPSNETLLWDRLPMTITFMAFFCMVIGSSTCKENGYKLLFPLLLAGMGSVFYWYITELLGKGDLRPYALVQFLPIILIPLVILLYKAQHLYKPVALIILLYGMAKVFEYYDESIFNTISFISGHTLKHICAAAAVYVIHRKF